jgi:catechol 2,3-dioxygenase-like lactoylglutathione lyase family enzyme
MTSPSFAPLSILETCLYAADLDAAERFYGDVLGLPLLSRLPGRHVFFRCEPGVFLVFNPAHTRANQTRVGGATIPLHGCEGAGHAAFRVPEAELPVWRERLRQANIPIESEVAWPGGGRSIYLRDPAGNSIELATPEIWEES